MNRKLRLWMVLFTCVFTAGFAQIIHSSEKGMKVVAPWKIILSSTGQRVTMYYGEYGDKPVPGDYDGDGVTDLAVWRRFRRPEYNGPYSKWHIRLSSTDKDTIIDFGNVDNDHPMQADYDGDGKTDLAFFRDTDNTWYIKQSSNGQLVTKTFDPTPANTTNDDYLWEWYLDWNFWSFWPVAADFDGDGKADLGAFRPMTAQWKYQKSLNGTIVTLNFGKAGDANTGAVYDIPVPGDNDGDGKAELAVWRPLDKKWEINTLSGLTDTIGYQLGIPAPGDYDGDGKTDKCVFEKEPRIKFTPIAQQVIPRSGIPDYDYQVSVYNDNGTHHAVWCGLSPTGKLDAVWYSKSTTGPTSGFSDPKLLDDGGCDCAMIKIPGAMNNRCGGNPVYLLYYEGDNHDPTPGAPYNGNLGNRVLMKYSCDANTWVKIPEQALSLPANTPEYYGKGHPQVYLKDNKVMLSAWLEDAAHVGGGLLLSVSNDGEHFTELEFIGAGGGKVRFVEEANIFIGTHSSGTIYDMDELYHFKKDYAAKENRGHVNQYLHVADLAKIPEQKLCSWGSGVGSDEKGMIKGNTAYVYTGLWDQNNGLCDGRYPPYGLLNPRIYTIKAEFQWKKTGCIGNNYGSCKTGSCSGLRQRTCLNDSAWGGWTSCTVSDNQAPVFLSCPHDTSFIYTGNTYTYTTPVAVDNCIYTVSRTTGLGSGAMFPVGATTETYIATDGNDNTDTCKFTITVTANPCQPDLDPPIFTFCPNDTVIADTINIFNYPSPQATDNCVETISLVTGLGSGQHFPKGITTETYVAKDGANNTDTCRFTVQVIGTTSIKTSNDNKVEAFFIYPNPAKEQLYITPIKPMKGEGKITITSVDGRFTHETTFLHEAGKTHEVSLSDIPAGLYFIKIYCNDWKELKKLQILK